MGLAESSYLSYVKGKYCIPDSSPQVKSLLHGNSHGISVPELDGAVFFEP